MALLHYAKIQYVIQPITTTLTVRGKDDEVVTQPVATPPVGRVGVHQDCEVTTQPVIITLPVKGEGEHREPVREESERRDQEVATQPVTTTLPVREEGEPRRTEVSTQPVNTPPVRGVGEHQDPVRGEGEH